MEENTDRCSIGRGEFDYKLLILLRDSRKMNWDCRVDRFFHGCCLVVPSRKICRKTVYSEWLDARRRLYSDELARTRLEVTRGKLTRSPCVLENGKILNLFD